MIELKNFIKISKYAGERFDLVQAGGGNSSVKFNNNEMIIKASGVLLSEVNENSGYSIVDIKKIRNILYNKNITNEKIKTNRETHSKNLIKDATLDKSNRPSIETLLHSTLYKYTLHTHPIVVNMILIQKEWKNIILSIFKSKDVALVPYRTPGIELAIELERVINKFEVIPKIIFLQNHGLIVSSSQPEEIQILTDLVLNQIEQYLELDMSKYKLTNKISSLINTIKENSDITYLVEDVYLNQQLIEKKRLFKETPFFPDSVVFCGASTLILEDLSETSEFDNYIAKYHELPKVIIFKNYIFLRALNIKKAKEIEEVLKFQIMVLEKNLKNEKNFLNTEEVTYLTNWEAENYRKKI